MTKTNSLLLAGVLSATLMTSVNVNAAETAAPAAEPASPHTVTTNVGLFSDYIFRGVSYGKERGAIQGGMDYSHTSGLYAGVWASSVQADSPLMGNTTEVDLYAGYVHTINPDLSLNVGFLQFWYPNHKTYPEYTSQNTSELNAAVTYKYFTLKHSYALSDYFGVVGSDGSGYTEVNASYPVPQLAGLNVTGHVGHLHIKNFSAGDYTDYMVGVNKDFSIAGGTGYNVGVNYIYNDADSTQYYGWNGNSDPALGSNADSVKFNWVGSRTMFYLKRTF